VCALSELPQYLMQKHAISLDVFKDVCVSMVHTILPQVKAKASDASW
jgi:hypothetical protein